MTVANWTALPVLDISRLEAGPAEKEKFLAELRRTTHDLGFFYLTGHGIDPGLIRWLLGLARRFFELPEADKLEIEMVNSPHFRGYNRVGMERTRGKADWREQIDIGAERTALGNDPHLPIWTRLQGPNQWPAALPELKEVVLQYQAAAAQLAIRLVRAFALVLGQGEHIFDPLFETNPHQLMKIIRYPGRDRTEDDQGVGSHKDGGFVTILLQDVQEGLEVEYEGNWIAAPPVPGTFVINIGELLEMASNGYLRATVHRAITPPAGTDRLSIGYFFSARLDASIPLLELPPELARGQRGLTQDALNPLFYEVGKNLMKSRLRSHPDVAQRHHADLLQAADR